MVMSRSALIGSCIGWMLLAFSLEGIKGKNNSEMGHSGSPEFSYSLS